MDKKSLAVIKEALWLARNEEALKNNDGLTMSGIRSTAEHIAMQLFQAGEITDREQFVKSCGFEDHDS